MSYFRSTLNGSFQRETIIIVEFVNKENDTRMPFGEKRDDDGDRSKARHYNIIESVSVLSFVYPF